MTSVKKLEWKRVPTPLVGKSKHNLVMNAVRGLDLATGYPTIPYGESQTPEGGCFATSVTRSPRILLYSSISLRCEVDAQKQAEKIYQSWWISLGDIHLETYLETV